MNLLEGALTSPLPQTPDTAADTLAPEAEGAAAWSRH